MTAKALVKQEDVHVAKRGRGAPIGNKNFLKGQPRFITEALIRKLLEVVKDPRDCATPAEAKIQRRNVDFMVDTLVRLALNGDTTCLRLVMDRVEGHATQTMLFKPAPEEGEQEALELRAELTLEKIRAMTPEERIGLYRASLSEAGRPLGSS